MCADAPPKQRVSIWQLRFSLRECDLFARQRKTGEKEVVGSFLSLVLVPFSGSCVFYSCCIKLLTTARGWGCPLQLRRSWRCSWTGCWHDQWRVDEIQAVVAGDRPRGQAKGLHDVAANEGRHATEPGEVLLAMKHNLMYFHLEHRRVGTVSHQHNRHLRAFTRRR